MERERHGMQRCKHGSSTFFTAPTGDGRAYLKGTHLWLSRNLGYLMVQADALSSDPKQFVAMAVFEVAWGCF